MSAITLTFGDRCENHKGMEIIGTSRDTGLSLDELLQAKVKFESLGCMCILIDLVQAASFQTQYPNIEPAYILLIQSGCNAIIQKPKLDASMYMEHINLNYDTKAKMYGKVVNKNARHNLCFSDYDQEPNYEEGKGRVINFNRLIHTNTIRNRLPEFFGNKCLNLQCESNLYYDVNSCGIGYHGDSERKIVVGIRLGTTIPLCFQWYLNSNPIGNKIIITINNADMYVMSSKAVGTDWKTKKVPTLRHAAGCDKFTTVIFE